MAEVRQQRFGPKRYHSLTDAGGPDWDQSRRISRWPIQMGRWRRLSKAHRSTIVARANLEFHFWAWGTSPTSKTDSRSCKSYTALLIFSSQRICYASSIFFVHTHKICGCGRFPVDSNVEHSGMHKYDFDIQYVLFNIYIYIYYTYIYISQFIFMLFHSICGCLDGRWAYTYGGGQS